jgi:hypothetical protein
VVRGGGDLVHPRRMSRSLVVVAILSSAGVAHAADSTWLICKGIAEHGAKGDVDKSHVVVSLHEHRGADGGSRDLDVTLIYGVHVSRGVVIGKTHGTKDGDVTGKAVPVKLSLTRTKTFETFTGTGEVSSDNKTFTMKGSVDWAFGHDPKPTMVPFSAKLTCERLDDLAIKK